MNVQILKDKKGRATHAILPIAEYKRLLDSGDEDAALIRLAEPHRHEETFPAEVAARIASGENPLKVIREWRGMSQAYLAESSGVAKNYISQIEREKRNAGRKVAEKLGAVLKVSVQVIMDL